MGEKKRLASETLKAFSEAGSITKPNEQRKEYEKALNSAAQITGESGLIGSAPLGKRIELARELLIGVIRAKAPQFGGLKLKTKEKPEKEAVEVISPDEMQPLAKRAEESTRITPSVYPENPYAGTGVTIYGKKTEETGMKVYNEEEAQKNKSYKWKPEDSDPNNKHQEKIAEDFTDYYKKFGIARNATNEEIKKAHRELVRKLHPDVSNAKKLSPEEFNAADLEFAEINIGRDILMNEEKRLKYNAQLAAYEASLQQQNPTPSYRPQSQGSGFTQTATGFARDKATQAVKDAVGKKVAGTVAGKAVQAGATKAAGVVAKKVGGKLALRGIGQLIGSFVPGLGNLAAFLITEGLSLAKKLFSKLTLGLFKWLKNKTNSKGIASVGLGMLALGGIIGSLFVGALGAGLVGLSLAGGGIGLVVGGAIAGVTAFFGLIGLIILAEFVIAFLIAVFTVILVTAFILLIINNSGYVTPFAPELAVVQDANSNQSFNIQVTKTAVSGSQFNNGPFPLNVEYEVTVTALKGDLTNIAFNNGYQITQQPLVAVAPNPTLPTPPSSISEGQKHTFRYTVEYTDKFKDSYVCDTLEVAANAGATRDSSSATACITIGKSPITVSCPSGWPVALGSGRVYQLTQGFNTFPTGSHGKKGNEEAVDITRQDQNNLRPDDYVITTHDGVVQKIGTTEFGNRIQIIGVCNGKTFVSYYGHLRNAAFAQGLSIGQQIPKGTRVGLVGNTGAKGLAYHVHYAFYPLGGVAFMGNPYIPVNRESIRGCGDFAECGSIIIQ